MKTNSTILLASCLLVGLLPFKSNTDFQEPSAPVQSGETAFQNGEQLTYKIYYNLNFIWVPAG